MNFLTRLFLSALALVAAVIVLNLSVWAPAPTDPHLQIIAHRGVHQTYHRENLESDTCTAQRIDVPTHQYMENTVASSKAAFEYGADIVEIDIHPTTDGLFAVWHDWTIDCRSDGQGVTRKHSMAYLKTLDIGYGYTTDGGRSYPFRGQHQGQMPELADMFSQMQNGAFLINFKGGDKYEAELLFQRLQDNPSWRERIWSAYGGDAPSALASTLIPNLNGFGRKSVRRCLIEYVLLGWSSYMPEACKNTKIMVPLNLTWAMSGWPNRFLQRMHAVNSEIILIGPVTLSEIGTTGIDNIAEYAQIPQSFEGYIWTNKIEIIGPHHIQAGQ